MPAPSSKDVALRKASKEYARKKVAAVFEKTNLVDHTEQIPQFERSELVMGKLLGKGGFGTVKEIRSFSIHEGVKKWKPSHPAEEDPQVAKGERENRKFIATHAIRGSGHTRYAVKYLSPEVISDPGKFCQAIIDFDIETRFLSSLEHPNIIHLRAVANVDPVDEEYFLVMDRLYDTLVKRMDKWKSQNKRNTGFAGKLMGGKTGSKSAALMDERLLACFDLCSALEYLHMNNIVYRDIKPENIGFDVRDDIKLFDFGLSKELHPDERLPDGTYKLTAMTGSIVYMAPEVALGKPYNTSADVYSISILMYEMLALHEAFPVTYTLKKYKDIVHLGGKRPKLDGLSGEVQGFLELGWHPDFVHERINMAEMAKMVRDEVKHVRGNDDEHGLTHQRRRSSYNFQRQTSSSISDSMRSS